MPSRRRGRGLIALAGCLLVVAVLAVITPDPETDFRRRYADVGIGEWGAARTFDARVIEVGYGRVVQPPADYQDPVHSKAVFVVAEVAIRSTSNTDLIMDSLQFRTTDGRTYHPRGQFVTSQLPTIQPGFTGYGQIVFQVPRHRVGGARMVIDPRAAAFDWYDSAVRVRLPDDPVIASTPIKLRPARTEVTR